MGTRSKHPKANAKRDAKRADTTLITNFRKLRDREHVAWDEATDDKSTKKAEALGPKVEAIAHKIMASKYSSVPDKAEVALWRVADTMQNLRGPRYLRSPYKDQQAVAVLILAALGDRAASLR